MLEVAWRSERGPKRRYQEDAAHATPERGLLLVADGAGGNQPADRIGPFLLAHIAAQLADQAPSPSALEAAIRDAERAYLRAAEGDVRLQHAGCALVAAWLDPETGRGWLTHIGDCRAWRWRAGAATQLTLDHSLAQRLLEMGKITEAERDSHPHRRILLQMLCVSDKPVEIEITEIALRPGDRLLLCTDGVLMAATAARLGALLGLPVEEAAQRILEEGLALDGSDNAALVVAAWR